MSADWQLSVVIPVYNSAGSLTPLVERLRPVLEIHCDPYEVILVNDGSTDGSWKVVEKLCQQFSFVRGIDFLRNYGQHSALLAGIRAAHYDVIVTIDDDLQNPPEEIPRLLQMLAEGYDVVYGLPEHERHGLWRPLASRLTKRALKGAMGAETAKLVSAFRVFRSSVRDAFMNYQSSYVSIDVLLTWGAARFGAVKVRHEPRKEGVSNYTLAKLVTHALDMMTGFSTWPLRLASFIGFSFTLFGVAILVYVVGRFLKEGGVVPGFPFLASKLRFSLERNYLPWESSEST